MDLTYGLEFFAGRVPSREPLVFAAEEGDGGGKAALRGWITSISGSLVIALGQEGGKRRQAATEASKSLESCGSFSPGRGRRTGKPALLVPTSSNKVTKKPPQVAVYFGDPYGKVGLRMIRNAIRKGHLRVARTAARDYLSLRSRSADWFALLTDA